MAIHIYMVRHGETYFNLLRRFQGFSDAPLTNKGIEDGHKAGKRLAQVHFDGAYSSDLTRAIHTARYALSENQAGSPKEPELLPDFREENFGTFEGVDSQVTLTFLNGHADKIYPTYTDMINEKGMAYVMDLFAKYDPYQLAESYDDFTTRVKHGFDQISAKHRDGDQVLLVSHGTAIRGIADMFGRPDISEQAIQNGSVMHLDLHNDGSTEILEFNDITTQFTNHQ
ncbi:histidine phosphatase family protein [Lactobacillaceae bacterium L1_55_11]|nr:histidine phosphatase family protein [Lactobacillaceae bacterium L1_55_11]